jgi:hypothetical protein
MTKLNYGIKVSKRGFNVIDLDQKGHGNNAGSNITPHIEYALALPYLLGAKVQIQRYQFAASTLDQNPTNGVINCIHEVSNLFEDLNTVNKYIEKCGNTHEFHKIVVEVRNHIRHDTLDQYNNESEYWKKNRRDRAGKLKIDPRLQTSLGFSLDLIKVEETEIKISEIVEYLDWADKVIKKVMNDAKDKGQIK